MHWRTEAIVVPVPKSCQWESGATIRDNRGQTGVNQHVEFACGHQLILLGGEE